jgi:hypothetical protein
MYGHALIDYLEEYGRILERIFFFNEQYSKYRDGDLYKETELHQNHCLDYAM